MSSAAHDPLLSCLRSAASAHRARTAVIGVIVVAIVAAGVAIPLSQGPKSSAGTTTTLPSGSTSKSTSTTTGGTGAGARVQRGIDLWWKRHPNETEAAVTKEAQAIIRYISEKLHANWVTIGFPLYTDSKTSTDVFTTTSTPSVSDLEMLAKTARAAGLHVGLRPLLELGTKGYVWRGLLKPSNLSTFFSNYYTALKPYLEMAQSNHIPEVDYASEFISLTRKSVYAPYWQSLINNMRQVYSGQLIYAESTAQLGGTSDIVPHLTEYGVHSDAYFGVSGATPTASEQTLYNGWTSVMSKLPSSELHAAVLQEVGIDAQPNGFVRPATVAGPPADLSLLAMQKTWFEMICHVVRHYRLAGVYFWNVDFNLDPRKIDGSSSTLGPTIWQNRPGAEAIASCFKTLAG